MGSDFKDILVGIRVLLGIFEFGFGRVLYWDGRFWILVGYGIVLGLVIFCVDFFLGVGCFFVVRRFFLRFVGDRVIGFY